MQFDANDSPSVVECQPAVRFVIVNQISKYGSMTRGNEHLICCRPCDVSMRTLTAHFFLKMAQPSTTPRTTAPILDLQTQKKYTDDRNGRESAERMKE
jgi:hypothetical protein